MYFLFIGTPGQFYFSYLNEPLPVKISHGFGYALVYSVSVVKNKPSEHLVLYQSGLIPISKSNASATRAGGGKSNKAAVAELHHKARTTLEYLIEHIPEGELRASFMGLPEVKQVLRP